MVRVAFIACSQ
jgi:hypothetical protein